MEAWRPIPVLTWHKVSPRWEPGITVVSPARFRLQVEALKDAGAHSVSLAEYIRRDGLQEPGEGLCLLCFDDAYECVADEAFPVLRRAGLTAALFPVLGYLGEWNRWDRGLLGRRFRHLDEGGIRRLLEAGWSVGLHGYSHRALTGCSLSILERELVDARSELELTFGQTVHAIAWPFGRCDRRAVRVAEAAGLRAGFGQAPPFPNQAFHRLCRPRLAVYPLHGAAQLRAMWQGAGPDALQRLAGWGARLSALIGGRLP
ncbi:MAG: polysaccharide deacetylase family protein [Candidatus Delongbacteria bacterium]